jgi:DNA modification methylase
MTQPNRMPIAGLKTKDMVGIPWRVAFALQADGWWLRSDIIWHKPNAMPESVKDRPTRAHEYVFLLTKAERYYYDHEAVCEAQSDGERRRRLMEQQRGLTTTYELKRDMDHSQPPPGRNGCARSAVARSNLAVKGTRNRRSVWIIETSPGFTGGHVAQMPPRLARLCILAGCPSGGLVLDPFAGTGTTGMAALELGRRAVLIELNGDYVKMMKSRCAVTTGLPLGTHLEAHEDTNHKA